MLAKGKSVTLKAFTNVLAKVEAGTQQLVGARYESSNLSVDIPISGVIENLSVSASNDYVSGTLYFRPVAEQVESLQLFRTLMEVYSLAVFPDEVTELPKLISDYETDRVASDTVVSNIQEIPMEFHISQPSVYRTKIKLRDKRYTQFVLEEADGALNVQSLVLVFANSSYDGETLLGYWSEFNLNRTEGLKLLQFVANGSVLPSLVGSVSIYSPGVLTDTYPLFKDYKLTFYKSEAGTPYLRLTCDTASILLEEADIKGIRMHSIGAYTYVVKVQTRQRTVIELLLG